LGVRIRALRLILTIVLVVGALTAPLATEAQLPKKIYRIGYLSMAPGPSPRSEALQQGLRDLGYVEGQGVAMEYRWAEGHLSTRGTATGTW
jgi:putative ABC transport system substrate-binding protein